MGSLGLSLALITLCPTSAQADVMQVGPAGYTWIAGAPSGTAGTPIDQDGNGIAEVDDNLNFVDEVPLNTESLTIAGDPVGPARWHQRIAQLAAKYDISPSLLEAVVWQESRWNESAISRVGARGLAQLMPSTARQMGIDASDPAANLEGGARYLRLQLDRFHGDVEKALAAYNAGPGRVQQAGGVPNIAETRAYVAAIMGRLSSPVRQ
ncbi:lytic transglycosylase domain-containing protein [Novosphingobium sp. 9]|uniref:lytic transglycosylase domain-containing protein n=1 Tax=Novosphingobium sp. 9 TaxID=2025349 RepID=UPI0021B60CFD|nr:lytic transglycosylase domain-containing protein [Novosphingobium sp. 9]